MFTLISNHNFHHIIYKSQQEILVAITEIWKFDTNGVQQWGDRTEIKASIAKWH